MARHLYHRSDDPDIAALGLHIPTADGQLAQHHLAQLALHSHRYGGGRCDRGAREYHQPHRAGKLSQASCRPCDQRGGALSHRLYADDAGGLPPDGDDAGHGGTTLPSAWLDR